MTLTLLLLSLLGGASAHDKRDLSQLEYVVSVLEQQGRLAEVDSDLLARINSALDRPVREREERLEIRPEPVRPEPVRPREERPDTRAELDRSFLERARLRQQRLFGKQSRKNEVKDLCREERDNMRRLERRVLELEEELEIMRESHIQQARHIAGASQQVNIVASEDPLDRLLKAAAREETVELQGSLEDGVVISSQLVTPTPSLSTIISSLSSVTVVTVTHTRELVVNFHGRKIPTQLLEEEVVTSTVEEMLTSTVEITPTPYWEYVTVTPSATETETVVTPPPETVNNLFLRQRIEQEKAALMERIQALAQASPVLPGVPAEVVEIPKTLHNVEALQQYVEDLRRLRSQKTATISAEPRIAQPSTSVSTIFMSGTKPGEFSTSLVTLTLEDRVRREASRAL